MSEQNYPAKIQHPSRIERRASYSVRRGSVAEIMPFLEEGFINLKDRDDAISKISAKIISRQGFSLFTMNLDHLCKLKRYQSFRRLYEKADFVSADGWPVAYLARHRTRKIARTTGADLVYPVCKLAAQSSFTVFFFGSSQAVLDESSRRLCRDFPNLTIVGKISPPAAFDPRSAFARQAAAAIAASEAQLCFVALGAPTQEAFSEFAMDFAPNTGFLCVGAALDFIVGAQRRAPKIFRATGFEWAWRCALSPRRLARRYAQCLVVLMEIVLFRLTHRGSRLTPSPSGGNGSRPS